MAAGPIPQIGNPLTDNNYRDINKGLNHLSAGQRLIDMAKEAGLDVTEYQNAYNLVRSRLEGIKRQFFPDRP